MRNTIFRHTHGASALLRFAMSLLCCVLAVVIARAEFPESFRMRYITIDDGLNRNYIDHIFRDSKGFVWFSLGGGGLVRYDGHSILSLNDETDGHNLSTDFVRCVAEDAHRRLWVATDCGLVVVDLNKMNVVPIASVSESLSDLGVRGISSVNSDAYGNIWAGCEGVIVCLSFNSDGTLAMVARHDTKNSHNFLTFSRIGKAVWTGFNGKIYALEPEEEKIVAKQVDAALPDRAFVHQMIEKGEDVWIATSHGLVRYNQASRISKLYVNDPADGKSISQDFVTDLAIGPDNRLIASTLNGYNIYNAITDDFARVCQEEGGLNSPFINCLYVDGPNLWIGTESCGVNLLTPKGIDCEFYPTHHPVNAVYADPTGTVWVGCVEGGLYQLDVANDCLQRVADASSSLPHNSVSAIAMDTSGRLWVGTWGGGLAMLNSNNPKECLLRLTELGGMQRLYVGSIIYDYINDGVWIGANPGIFFYDCKSGRAFEPIANSADVAYGPIGAVIDNQGHLWMGCSNGLYDIDLRSRKGDEWNFRFLDKMLSNPKGDVKEKVSFLTLGPDGSLWVGSDSHGLYHRMVNDGKETFVNYSVAQGLARNAVKGIAFNGKMALVSTEKGLTSLAMPDGTANTFLKENGLPEDSFYWNAASYTHETGAYFGAITGLVAVKEQAQWPGAFGRVVFTSLLVDNSPDVRDYVSTDISVADKVRLHESNRSFTVTFSSFDFSSGPSLKYQYMLEGFDEEWIQLPEGRNDASYTNLAPGHYTLKVKYGPNGMASVLPIDVKSYFYNTYWFMILVLMVIASLTWLYNRMRMRDLIRQRTELAQKVKDRTREITEQKLRIEEQARQVQQFTVERLSFFTNLTHEFRTPITLVLGPIEHAIKLSDNPKVQNQLHMAFRNAQYLMSLVNQLMDFRKIESGKMEIQLSKGDFRDFVEDVASSFRTVLDKRDIRLVTYYHLTEAEIYFDKEALRKLMHNFLSNASKYTPDGGVISIYAADLRIDGKHTLYINVKDTGDGLDPNDIDKVFDKYYQGKSAMKYPSPMGSSGLGLHLCKSIVEAYGGTLQAKNNHGAGCCFRMLLPLAEEPTRRTVTSRQEAEPEGDVLPTLLVVEDNADMREYIRSILSDRFRVIEATDGVDALEKLKDADIDFIVSDLMMPRMDGLPFVRKLRENFDTSHIPVLILTAKTADASKLESFRTGVDGYLTKPFDEEMLLARIEAILANRKLRSRKIMLSISGEPVIDAEMPAEEVADTPDSRFIKQVMETIEANYKNSYYEVGDFADNLGVSRTVLNKKLQSLLGISANKFIRDYRLKVALDLIKKHREGHTMNISEIAYDVGFNDSKYFTRCFTKHYGVPPSSVMQGVDPPAKC